MLDSLLISSIVAMPAAVVMNHLIDHAALLSTWVRIHINTLDYSSKEGTNQLFHRHKVHGHGRRITCEKIEMVATTTTQQQVVLLK